MLQLLTPRSEPLACSLLQPSRRPLTFLRLESGLLQLVEPLPKLATDLEYYYCFLKLGRR